MSHPENNAKSRVAATSIFASAAMAAAKFVVGIAIGSLALISEALHSSVDLVATVVTWMVVRVSGRPADEQHHYGHGKFESVSALGVIAMLYVLAGGILVESWARLREGAAPPTLSAIPFIVLLVDIAVNFWRARALHRTAHDTKSQALAADALHFASDVLGSIAFYERTLGLRLSDRASDLVAFMHGIHGSDHHMLALVKSSAPGFHHCSWDVSSINDIGLGAMRMHDKGFTKGWGLGRHVLGSNYFHYVRDPWGSFAEYSCDIDYIPKEERWPSADHKPEDSFYLWGPEVPREFTINCEAGES